MTARQPGIGDRWMAGERLPGIDFAHHDAVAVTAGPHAGRHGTIALLVGVRPEPSYLVVTAGGDVRVRQSELEPRR